MAGKKYTLAEIKEHNTLTDLWIAIHGKVYDVSGFVEEHPGGEEVILDYAGMDASDPFDEIGHSKHAMKLLKPLEIGELDKKTSGKSSGKSSTSTTTTTKTESSSSTILIVFVILPLIAYILYKYLDIQ